MSHKITVYITETLSRLIEVGVDEIDCDAVKYTIRNINITCYLSGGLIIIYFFKYENYK